MFGKKEIYYMDKLLLMILDGWGIGDNSKADVISQVETPYWNKLLARYPHSQLLACGESVGLPEGQMGNSEVGHLNIGAGRVVYQDLVKINKACEDGTLMQMHTLQRAFNYVKEHKCDLHFIGLVSDGGVHSHVKHVKALSDMANRMGVPRHYVHCFTDGRDTDPKSGASFVEQLEGDIIKNGGAIASVTGRFYAMDRDKHWDRIKVAYDAMVYGFGTKTKDVVDAINGSYYNGITDEFIQPIIHTNLEGQPIATIKDNDVVIFFNYRNDRTRELTRVLTQEDMPAWAMRRMNLQFYCMTPYDPTFTDVNIIFDKEIVKETLAETISKAGGHQFHIAETEKYAHVTFFLNGGREEPLEGEERQMINSPRVKTYDLQPEMSAYDVANALSTQLDRQFYDLAVVNFANGDMVGHTGKYHAIEKAVETVDDCLRQVVETAKRKGYKVIIIADHGNCDVAINNDGSENTAHSLNPVPFIYIDETRKATVENGILADVAPSVLAAMGVEQPKEMTGKSLIKYQ